MYCAKCGTKNPDSGKYCRKCGAGLPRVIGEGDDFLLENQNNDKLSPQFSGSKRKKKKETSLSWESAMGSIGAGIAFIIISFILAYQPVGFGWWFWLLIPGFGALGAGIAKVIRLQKQERQEMSFGSDPAERQMPSGQTDALPPDRTVFAQDEVQMPHVSGEIVPPSVTEGTTRHLKIDPEIETALPREED